MPKRGIEEKEEETPVGDGKKKEGRKGGWSEGKEAGVKQRTRLVPAFHSHWPCRSSYRWSSRSSSFSFFFSASYSSFLPTEKERER